MSDRAGRGRATTSLPGELLGVASITTAAFYLFLISEWLFFVTRPSLFTVMTWPQKTGILLTAALFTAIPGVCFALLLLILWRPLAARWGKGAGGAALLVPAVVLAATTFLLVENFTKTLFDFNVGTFTSPVRYAYAAGCLLLVARFHRSLARRLAAPWRRGRRPAAIGFALLVMASAAVALVRYDPRPTADRLEGSERRVLPNILILSSDAVKAESMSIYGYRRNTTPFLQSRVDEFLISENHFSNSSSTAAAAGALLSGKLPITTGLIREGDIYRGEHVFQHLPGLLRQLGYFNVEISARYYGDAYDMNIRQGFHVANGRSLSNETLPVMRWVGSSYPSEFYFVGLALERVRERILHSFGMADMQDFYEVVARKSTLWSRDDRRIGMLKTEIALAPRPFFVHVHLLDTHGPWNRARKPHFSRGRDPTNAAGRDFYDDAILAFDDYVRDIFDFLESAGELDSTLLIINSDHGTHRRARERLPLMIRFPNAERRGRIYRNTQRIDIAPTILSWLGLEPPSWMEGQSLIDGELDPLRPILGAGSNWRRGLDWLSLIQCQRSFVLDLKTLGLETHEVRGHRDRCPEQALLTEEEARRYLHARIDASPHISAPFLLGLDRLLEENDLEARRAVARAIRDGRAEAEWLGSELAVAQTYPDFWTRGTQPAALLVRNRGPEPQSHRLWVRSGAGGEFPASVFLQDDETTHEHVFASPGTMALDLAEVPPGSERLFIVWTDRIWTATERGRVIGVRLSPSGIWLSEVLRQGRRVMRRDVTRKILEGRLPNTWIGDQWIATNVDADLWTRGTEPAGLAIGNDRRGQLTPRLVVHSGPGREFPFRFFVDDGRRTHEYVFRRPGSLILDLAEVRSGSARSYIIWSEQAWTRGSQGQPLGIRLQPSAG